MGRGGNCAGEVAVVGVISPFPERKDSSGEGMRGTAPVEKRSR